MYVIFPAEEVIDLTYGIGPNSSGSSSNAAFGARLRQPSPAPCADAACPALCQAHGHALGGGHALAHAHALAHPHALALAQRNAAQQHLAALAGGSASVAASASAASAAAAAPGGGSGSSGGGGVGGAGGGRKTKDKAERKGKKSALKGGDQAGAAGAAAAAMAAGGEVALRELVHPALNEALKQHNAVSFKLVRTVSDFTQQLSQVYEQHAEELQLLVANFRKRNAELRKERPACPSALFHTWETLLQEVEVDSQAHSDIASVLGRQVSRPLLERSFHRKIQSRKVFTHREGYETILTKTEDKLVKCRQDYKTAYLSYLGSPSTVTLSAYLDAHNEYVAQLHATNGMLERYHQEALPQLLQELEDVYSDLCATLSESLLSGAEVISSRAIEQSRRYDGLATQCRAVAGPPDLAHFVRSLPPPPQTPLRPALRHNFAPPQPPPPPEPVDGPDGPDAAAAAAAAAHHNDATANPPPPLKNEIVVDRLASVSARGRFEALRKEASDLEVQIKQLQDALDTLLRIQQRSLESSLFNKANELQEDISMKRFELRVAQIHLGAVRAQKELFGAKADAASDAVRERKMSSSSTGSMKNKWLKAFKSLKTTTPGNGQASAASPRDADKRNGKEREMSQQPVDAAAHAFQEYTYKKITACDACTQVLRGHTRQGLKCRNCKLNVHVDCQDKLGRCQPKSRLLRRQKSTSEIETRLPEPPEEEKPAEIDLIYQVLKQAGEISGRAGVVGGPLGPVGGGGGSGGVSTRAGTPAPAAVAAVAAAAVAAERERERGGGGGCLVNHHNGRDGGGGGGVGGGGGGGTAGSSAASSAGSLHRRAGAVLPPQPHGPSQLRAAASSLTVGPVPHASSSAPSSPVHNRRLLSARNMRMSSVELPDDTEKSLSSASTSPCPSPVSHKPHRLLPTNLYVVLYNFKSRHPDELDLKAGYKVTVIDTSDADWWKGKCLGRVGFFPSKYVVRLTPGERPLQVTHNLQVSDGDSGLMLLKDQIVIQVGEELDGMVMIRAGDNRQGVCPLKFLQEV